LGNCNRTRVSARAWRRTGSINYFRSICRKRFPADACRGRV